MTKAAEIQTAEAIVVRDYVEPVKQELLELYDGQHIVVKSDQQYDQAGLLLADIRRKRKAMTAYFKDQPPATNAGPGQGICWLTRKAWDAANAIFNKFDKQFDDWDKATDGSMKQYKAQVEERARKEAEAKAAAERKRLEEEARKQREAAEKERQRLEAIAAEERRKAELERQARLKAEKAAAQSKRELEAARQRAEQERLRIKAEEEAQKRRAEEEAERVRQAAALKEQQARDVQPIITRQAPVSSGTSTRKVWKARVVHMGLFAMAAATEPELLTCLSVVDGRLNKLANEWAGKNAPDGVEFYEDEVSVSKRAVDNVKWAE